MCISVAFDELSRRLNLQNIYIFFFFSLLQDTSVEEAEVNSCWTELEAFCWHLVEQKKGEQDLVALNKNDVSPHLLIGLLDCVSHRLQRLTAQKEVQEAMQIAEMVRNMDFYIIHGLILCLLRLSK